MLLEGAEDDLQSAAQQVACANSLGSYNIITGSDCGRYLQESFTEEEGSIQIIGTTYKVVGSFDNLDRIKPMEMAAASSSSTEGRLVDRTLAVGLECPFLEHGRCPFLGLRKDPDEDIRVPLDLSCGKTQGDYFYFEMQIYLLSNPLRSSSSQ